jgi:Lipocalin-like domain
MTRMQTFAIASIAAASVTLCVDFAIAQSAKELVGTWQLVSNVIDQGGKKIDQFGPNPHGVLLFESNGRYALVIMRDGLPRFASNGRANGTPEENKEVVQGSIAHFGFYSVRDNSIVFDVEHSTFPNWDGGVQPRPFSMKGDEMSFFVAAASLGGGSSQVTWKRLK